MNNTSIYILVSWSLIVICYDIYTRTIPNFLSIGALLIALLTLSVTGLSVTHQSITSALIGFVVAIILTVPGYLLKLLGGGDVKLLCAIALLCGAKVMLASFTLASVGIVVFWILWMRIQWLNQILPLNINSPAIRAPKEKYIPFGAALGTGLILVLLLPELFNLTIEI